MNFNSTDFHNRLRFNRGHSNCIRMSSSRTTCRIRTAPSAKLNLFSGCSNAEFQRLAAATLYTRATVVAAAQSSTSFVPPLGREKARVFALNLRNRLIFKAADEEGAVESADFLGKKRVIKKT